MEAVRRASRGAMGVSPQDNRETFPQDSRDQDLHEEEEPLLSRRNSRDGEGQAAAAEADINFQQAQQEAAQEAAMSSGWFTWTLIFFASLAFGFWFYVNLKSWYILFVYYGSGCDQPLAQWLLVKLVLDVMSSATQQRQGEPPRPITWAILGIQNGWLVLGFNWCAECKTCQTTSPELYMWVQFLVVFGTVVTVFLMLLPVLFYMGIILVVHLVGTGGIKTQQAARGDTLEMLEKVKYSPDLFADSSDPNDTRPAGECCCCCENFDAEKAIVQTPCKHLYHQDCLGEWLKLARTCPICRSDLEAATEALSIEKQSGAAAGLDLEAPDTSSSGAGLGAIGDPAASSGSGARSSMSAGP